MLMPRKHNLSPVEHAACDAIKSLRESMGLSKTQFARQLGCTVRTLQRWERHNWVPRRPTLARLKQLKEMNDNLDLRDQARRPGAEPQKARVRNVPRKMAQLMAPRFLAMVLRRFLSGEVRFSREEFEREKPSKAKVQIRFEPEKEQYRVWVRRKQETQQAN